MQEVKLPCPVGCKMPCDPGCDTWVGTMPGIIEVMPYDNRELMARDWQRFQREITELRRLLRASLAREQALEARLPRVDQ